MKGAGAIALAYVIWGSMPVYWRALSSVGPLEILAHRAVWSCVFAFALLAARGEFGGAVAMLRSDRRAGGALILSGATITLNWYLYIWAVNSGRILETSLGYFMNPLVSILFGVVIFRERLGRVQWLALACGAAGVAVEIAALGGIPVVSLGLAVTFGLYGLEKKLYAVNPVSGMAAETALMTPFAIMWLIYSQTAGSAHFPYPLKLDLLLAGAGVLTATPLIVFAWGVPRTSMVLLGLIQYVSPTMTFLTAVLIYREPLSKMRMVTFALIWAGIFIYSADSLARALKKRRLDKPAAV